MSERERVILASIWRIGVRSMAQVPGNESRAKPRLPVALKVAGLLWIALGLFEVGPVISDYWEPPLDLFEEFDGGGNVVLFLSVSTITVGIALWSRQGWSLPLIVLVMAAQVGLSIASLVTIDWAMGGVGPESFLWPFLGVTVLSPPLVLAPGSRRWFREIKEWEKPQR